MSSSSSTAGLTTPPPSIEFNPPTHVAADGTIIKPSKQSITIFNPSEWVTSIQSYVTKIRKDLSHRAGLNPQIIQAQNAFADELDEAYDILKSDATDIDKQICNCYISIIDSGSKLSADLYTNLASTKRRVSDKLKMLASLQEHQQETTAALKCFMSSLDKGKGTARTHSATPVATTATACGTTPATTALSPAAAASTVHTQGGWIPAECFLDEL